MGLGPNLQSKRSSVVGFLRALYRANRYIVTHTDAQIADLLLRLPAFQGYNRDLLIEALNRQRDFFPWQTQFLVSQADWARNLREFVLWNLPGYSPDSSKFAYASMVDMSYLRAALPKPSTVRVTVAANGRVSLSPRSVLAGQVRLIVRDQSRAAGFIFNRKRITPRAFVGTKTVTVTLKGGRFAYSSDVRGSSGVVVARF